MKKLAALSFALALSFAQAGPALADDSASNTNTGPDSVNSATIDHSNSVDINISNTANVNYNIKMNLNTGGNTMSHNTTAGDLVSGDIDAKIALNTEINQTSGLCDGCLPNFTGGDNTALNEQTGPDSKNNASVKISNKFDYDMKNRADVDYKLNLDANTGGNTCSNNTTVGDCKSGDIRIGIAIATEINQGGKGGAKLEAPKGPGEPSAAAKPKPGVAGVTAPVAGAGGALFAAGSSLLLILAMLFAAANGLYFLNRRHPKFAFHLLNEGKVGKGNNH